MIFIRLLRFSIHILIGLFKVLLVFPWVGKSQQRAMKKTWSAKLLDHLGVRIEIEGSLPTGPLLLVANHVSWLDIYLINSLSPVAFVSKADVRQWPLIGWLAAHNDTIFLRRGSRGHAHQINQEIASVMADGCPVAVFPEGTTTDGRHILHFHGALLQPALDVGARVVPLAIRYFESDPKHASWRAAYAGETTLGQCLMAIVGAKQLTARLQVLPVLNGNDRKVLAVDARAVIAQALEINLD